MDYRKLQHTLDLAAEELDRKGMKDLADRVDFYNEKARRASPSERRVIARILRRIDREATMRTARRASRVARPLPQQDRRASALRRRLALRRRMSERQAREERLERSYARPEPRRVARRPLPRRPLRAMRGRFAGRTLSRRSPHVASHRFARRFPRR